MTVAWAVGLLVAAALQGVSALVSNSSMTNPKDLAIRIFIGLAAEAILLIATFAWRRRPAVTAA